MALIPSARARKGRYVVSIMIIHHKNHTIQNFHIFWDFRPWACDHHQWSSWSSELCSSGLVASYWDTYNVRNKSNGNPLDDDFVVVDLRNPCTNNNDAAVVRVEISMSSVDVDTAVNSSHPSRSLVRWHDGKMTENLRWCRILILCCLIMLHSVYDLLRVCIARIRAVYMCTRFRQ